ncbi:MAG: STAS domain-containing protein [Bacteroidales bacterium]|jgi:anti-anti-sigma factor|nr:STAS domain-containing protein [Bacteroidales bacterium]
METKITTENEKISIKVSGRLDTLSAAEFEKEIAPVMENDIKEVEIDMSELNYISSSGLRSFLIIKKQTGKNGGKLTLKNLTHEVKTVFDMTGFTSIFGL